MPRLSDRDWLDHGLRTLAKSGFASLKAATMAEALGVSRGSFYWHFKDIFEFKARLLEEWQTRTTDAIIQELDTKQTDRDRLPDLMIRAHTARPQLDKAIRIWAEYDDEARARVTQVDTLRIEYIRKLLVTAGLDSDTAEKRARFLYAAALGDGAIAPDAAAPFSSDDLRDLAVLLSQ
ncbi:MAG: TetR/AcrR family transcriptional regulator [Pseudomonadota bacterium]